MPGAQQASRPAKGYRLAAFPKEFEHNIWESLDRRFYIILISSLAVVYGFIILLRYSISDSSILWCLIVYARLKSFYALLKDWLNSLIHQFLF